jgi:transposase
MRVVGLDIHRSFAEAALIEEGRVRHLGRVDLVREKVVAFAKKLGAETEVVVEATGNTMAVVKLMVPHVKRVVIANPLQVRAIAHAKVKTDKIDAVVLAKLHAAGFLPEVWQPDEATECLRRQVARRAAVVQARTRLKNRIHSVLHANLILPYRGDLFSAKGRSWLAAQPIEADERVAIEGWLAELDRLAEDLARVDVTLAKAGLGDARVRRLMTITGINLTIAVGLVSAIGEIGRFSSAEKLVSSTSGSIRASVSRAMAVPTTAASPSRAALWRAGFWLRPPGPRRPHPGRFTPSSFASKPGVGSKSLRSRRLARSRFSFGTC